MPFVIMVREGQREAADEAGWSALTNTHTLLPFFHPYTSLVIHNEDVNFTLETLHNLRSNLSGCNMLSCQQHKVTAAVGNRVNKPVKVQQRALVLP